MTRGTPPRQRSRSKSSARRAQRRPGIAVAAAVSPLLLWAGVAQAQQDTGPIVFGQQEKRQIFSLQDIHATAELIYRDRTDDVKPKDGSPDSHFSESRFEENFTLSSLGYIYHPNLVDLNLSGTFGLQQISVDDSTLGKDNENGDVYQWDLNATILRKETAPVTLYSRRTHQLLDRELGPTIDETITTTGAIWDIRSKTIPTRIEAYHQDQEQGGFGDIGSFNMSQNTITWHSEAHPNSHQAWNWDYTLSQVDEHTDAAGGVASTSDSFVTQDAALTHSWDFGKDDRSNLSSILTYYGQSGDFDLQRFHLIERLRLHHSDTFETHYEYDLEQQSYLNIDELRNRGVVGFTHKLYKSLVTNVEAGAEDISRSSGSDSLEYWTNVDWEYTKRVPLGLFTGAFGAMWDQQQNDAQSDVTQIIDVQQAFFDPNPIVIARPGVIPSSIRITDPTGLIIYREGLDYQVRDFPDRTEIDRIVGGRIPNLQPVLLDYQLEPTGQNTTTTTSFYVGGRYEILRGPLRGLSPYARYRHQDQNIDSNDPINLIPNSFDDTIFGLEYDIWRFTFIAEQEYYDSTIAPFDATRFEARYLHRIRQNLTLSADVNYSMTKYTEENNQVDLLNVTGTAQYQFTRSLWGYVSATYRNETDDVRGTSRGIEEQAEIQWQHRQTFVYALFRNTSLNTDYQDETFQFIEVGIRREW